MKQYLMFDASYRLFIQIEIQVPVKLTPWIKWGAAMWAGAITIHILRYSQCRPAGAAQNRSFRIEQPFRPPLRLVSRHVPVAFVARIKFITTGKFDGDDIKRRMPVSTAAFLVDYLTFYDWIIQSFIFLKIFPIENKAISRYIYETPKMICKRTCPSWYSAGVRPVSLLKDPGKEGTGTGDNTFAKKTIKEAERRL